MLQHPLSRTFKNREVETSRVSCATFSEPCIKPRSSERAAGARACPGRNRWRHASSRPVLPTADPSGRAKHGKHRTNTTSEKTYSVCVHKVRCSCVKVCEWCTVLGDSELLSLLDTTSANAGHCGESQRSWTKAVTTPATAQPHTAYSMCGCLSGVAKPSDLIARGQVASLLTQQQARVYVCERRDPKPTTARALKRKEYEQPEIQNASCDCLEKQQNTTRSHKNTSTSESPSTRSKTEYMSCECEYDCCASACISVQEWLPNTTNTSSAFVHWNLNEALSANKHKCNNTTKVHKPSNICGVKCVGGTADTRQQHDGPMSTGKKMREGRNAETVCTLDMHVFGRTHQGPRKSKLSPCVCSHVQDCCKSSAHGERECGLQGDNQYVGIASRHSTNRNVFISSEVKIICTTIVTMVQLASQNLPGRTTSATAGHRPVLLEPIVYESLLPIAIRHSANTHTCAYLKGDNMHKATAVTITSRQRAGLLTHMQARVRIGRRERACQLHTLMTIALGQQSPVFGRCMCIVQRECTSKKQGDNLCPCNVSKHLKLLNAKITTHQKNTLPRATKNACVRKLKRCARKCLINTPTGELNKPKCFAHVSSLHSLPRASMTSASAGHRLAHLAQIVNEPLTTETARSSTCTHTSACTKEFEPYCNAVVTIASAPNTGLLTHTQVRMCNEERVCIQRTHTDANTISTNALSPPRPRPHSADCCKRRRSAEGGCKKQGDNTSADIINKNNLNKNGKSMITFSIRINTSYTNRTSTDAGMDYSFNGRMTVAYTNLSRHAMSSAIAGHQSLVLVQIVLESRLPTVPHASINAYSRVRIIRCDEQHWAAAATVNSNVNLGLLTHMQARINCIRVGGKGDCGPCAKISKSNTTNRTIHAHLGGGLLLTTKTNFKIDFQKMPSDPITPGTAEMESMLKDFNILVEKSDGAAKPPQLGERASGASPKPKAKQAKDIPAGATTTKPQPGEVASGTTPKPKAKVAGRSSPPKSDNSHLSKMGRRRISKREHRESEELKRPSTDSKSESASTPSKAQKAGKYSGPKRQRSDDSNVTQPATKKRPVQGVKRKPGQKMPPPDLEVLIDNTAATNGAITAEQVELMKFRLSMLMVERGRSNPKPEEPLPTIKFDHGGFSAGYMRITCNNVYARDWLLSVGNELNSSFEGASLRLRMRNQLPVLTKIKGFFPIPKAVEPSFVLELLGQQNEGIDFKEWRTVRFTKMAGRDKKCPTIGCGFMAVFGVDGASLAALEAMKYRLHFAMTTVRVRVMGGSTRVFPPAADTPKPAEVMDITDAAEVSVTFPHRNVIK